MVQKPLPAYGGDEPFIFVSYSHKDEESVYPEIRWLQDQGFNVWYDEGISGASHWRDAIAGRLGGCHLLLFYVTPHSAVAQVCRDELEFVLDLGRSVLSVHLEPTELPNGIKLAIANRQALFRLQLEPEEYERKLVAAIQSCLDQSISEKPGSHIARARKLPFRQIRAGLFLIVLICAVGLNVYQWLNRSESTRAGVLRYTIPQPEGRLTFQHEISPDGRYVAFQSIRRSGGIQIFLRALDTWDLDVLAGTEGATNLFWSPDSRQLAFFADGKLKAVALNGGPAEELSNVPGFRGASGTWGADNVIIFARSNKYNPGPLFRVSALGGEPAPLTTAEPGESHRFPTFIDRVHFLYTSSGGSSPGIYLASTENLQPVRVLADVSRAWFVNTGYDKGQLFFVREGKFMAQLFDTEKRRLAGEPVVVLESVPYANGGVAGVSLSRNGVLSYLGGRSRMTDSRFAWLNRAGVVIAEVGMTAGPTPVSLSPDGQKIASLRGYAAAERWKTDLWVTEVTRGTIVRKTFNQAIDNASNVVWGPNSDRVIFSADSANTGNIDLYQMDVRSSNPPELLLQSEYPKYPSSWSNDGRYLVYAEVHPDRQADLWYLSIEGNQPGRPTAFLQTEFIESGGQLSPDTKWIAYVSNETGINEIYVRPFPSGVGVWKISGGAPSGQPTWGPRGNELFYLESRSSTVWMMRTEVTTKVPASSGAQATFEPNLPEALFTLRFNGFDPVTGTLFYAVAPDGERFLVNHVVSTKEPVVNLVVNWPSAFGALTK